MPDAVRRALLRTALPRSNALFACSLAPLFVAGAGHVAAACLPPAGEATGWPGPGIDASAASGRPGAAAATTAATSITGTSPAAATSSTGLQPSRQLRPAPRGDAGRDLPIYLIADRIRALPERETVAEGDVEFRRGGLVIRADRLSYDTPDDRAVARGDVRISRDGAIYGGQELSLRVQRFEGAFLAPTFSFPALGARGNAERIEFIDSARSRAIGAEYTSCPAVEGREPDWLLRTRSVELDLETNVGVAEGAQLRFMGLPIVTLPRLSFPLGDTRRSGWLPPSLSIDNRSGVELAVPWYWNIAPQRDATFAPRLISRRGVGLSAEFRYLEPRHAGSVDVDWLPDDRLAGRSRQGLSWLHETRVGRQGWLDIELQRVSDDDWWKDFPDVERSLMPRLLPLQAHAELPWRWARGDGGARGEIQARAYGRVQQWQLLQAQDSFIEAPYERSPQLGLALDARLGRWVLALESEFNRFSLPHGQAQTLSRPTGERWHLLGALSHPWREPGWWVVPRVSLNAAAYRTDLNGDVSSTAVAAGNARRVIPSVSIDAGLELERRTRAFGRALVQTLEPRVFYVNTPYREQAGLPNYDAAAKDFNFVSIYTDDTFSGVDRVSDSHQVTTGFVTRLVDEASGAEALRLGLVQRYLLRNQRVAPRADGTPDGPPLEQRFSDVLLLGSTSVFPGWTLDGALQYSPDIQRSVRSIVSARWSPGPYRTVGATYRLARGLSEQVELSWQWPVYSTRRERDGRPRPGAWSGSCPGTWYSVGRFDYSLVDSRLTDSLLGLEYDAGCWIGRVVVRLSTGRSEATTRLLLQLELIGLSRLGSNPLRVLKENIPGYQPLRLDGGAGFGPVP
jgi:LPS-assembly protein